MKRETTARSTIQTNVLAKGFLLDHSAHCSLGFSIIFDSSLVIQYSRLMEIGIPLNTTPVFHTYSRRTGISRFIV
jgi:hypothetical protein